MENTPATSTADVPASFMPVPGKRRSNGWTARRQRAFIFALAELGSVRAACRRVGMSSVGAYQLRLAPGAESFRAAWDDALHIGVQDLADVAMERARNGVPVPVFWRGEQVGEKRWYNDRLLMFILKHHLEPRGDGAPLPTAPHTRRAQAAGKECPVCAKRAEEEVEDKRAVAAGEVDDWSKQIYHRYAAKVRSERFYRLSGDIVAADFTVRQLTHLELLLDVGGQTRDVIDRWVDLRDGASGDVVPRYASEVSRSLAEVRRREWEAYDGLPRPHVALPDVLSDGSHRRSTPCYKDRIAAQRSACQTIAQAQKLWEAAATPESWATWVEERTKYGQPVDRI